MTSITINNLGKKFGREWIFRQLTEEIKPDDKLVILGGNGSGKSTLLQIISGFVTPNEGEVIFKSGEIKITQEEIKNHVSLASPYLQLIDDFTLSEMLEHAAIFKPFLNSMAVAEIISVLELDRASEKFLRQFSSGMKQRVKLGMAILAEAPVLLLDEPASNLDRAAIDWYKKMIQTYATNKTILVCSNAITDEYFFCARELNVMNYKQSSKS